MIFLLILFSFLCFWKIRFSHGNEQYLSQEQTNVIKGIFAVVILCSHMSGYLLLEDNPANEFHFKVMSYLGQTMVAPYLFYSGYGIFYSFCTKKGYVSGFLSNRFLKTLFNFDLAIFLFILVQLLFSMYYPVQNYFFCWIGWLSVGNSNWFIFVILALYLIAFCGMLIEKIWKGTMLPVVTLLSATLWIILRFIAEKESWWYDTIAAFPLGMAFCAYKNTIDTRLLQGKKTTWYISAITLLALYLGWHHLKGVDNYGICSCLFCLIITVVTMKVRIGNPVLNWLGKHSFEIYILQRLPMLILSHLAINNNPSVFVPLSVTLSLILAAGFHIVTNRFWGWANLKHVRQP